MIKMSDVSLRQWTGSGIPFIPYGKLTIIQGDQAMENYVGAKYCSKIV